MVMELINKQLPGGGTALTLNLCRFSYGERAASARTMVTINRRLYLCDLPGVLIIGVASNHERTRHVFIT